MRRASIREMSGRVTVKVRFAGGDATFGRPTEWTSFRVRENELGLRALRPLLSKAMQVSASALNYLQYQDADGDWLAVCKDEDVIESANEPGGLRLQVLWRGSRDAFKPSAANEHESSASQRSAVTNHDRPSLLEKKQDNDTVMLTLKIARGDIEKMVAMGELNGAIALCQRCAEKGLSPKLDTFNAMLQRTADTESLDHAVQVFKLLMASSEAQPDARSYESLLTVAIDSGDLKLAVRTLKNCLKTRQKVDEAIVADLRRRCRVEGLHVKDVRTHAPLAPRPGPYLMEPFAEPLDCSGSGP